MEEPYPIPVKLNVSLIVGCSLLYFLLLYTGSLVPEIEIKVLLGFVFAIVMIPVYSLIHEAAHHTLHPSPSWNTFLGRWLCCLFVVSFIFFRHCHLKHHKKNRTDSEMWDLYYKHQNRWARYGNLYLMMIGFGYLALWLSVILFAIAPKAVNSTLFKKHTEIKGFLEGSDDGIKIGITRVESLIVLLFQFLCLWFLNWDVMTWLIFYLIHGFVWSSQNYINHAFSPRDIINGAHNLKIPVWLNLIYLNFNLHLAHHQNPKIPWLHLPKFIHSGKGRISFFRNYLRLWKGPRLTREASPEAFSK
jgi:fatty acid desaturase